MPQETLTTRTRSYRDEAEGTLLYDDEGMLTVERTEDKMIFKMSTDKHQNWLQVADELWCAVRMVDDWLTYSWMKEGKENFADLEEIGRDPEWEEFRQKEYEKYINHGDDAFLYLYFYDTYNWVLYENDEQYLFLYEMPIQESYELVGKHQVEAFAFWLNDDVAMMLHFLKSWYHRVNGYPETDEE